MQIKLGQQKVEKVDWTMDLVDVYEGEIVVTKETEKAIEITFTGSLKSYEIEADYSTVEYNDDGTQTDPEWVYGDLDDENEDFSETYWLPKSQVEMNENEIEIPEWLVKKNRILFAR